MKRTHEISIRVVTNYPDGGTYDLPLHVPIYFRKNKSDEWMTGYEVGGKVKLRFLPSDKAARILDASTEVAFCENGRNLADWNLVGACCDSFAQARRKIEWIVKNWWE